VEKAMLKQQQQAAAGCGEIENRDGVFQRAAATGGTTDKSLVALLTGCQAARRSLRDGKEDRLA